MIHVPMISSEDEDPPSESEKPPEALKSVTIRFDVEHYEALLRVSEFERLSIPETLRKLVRIADQMVTGAASPFSSRLEHLLLPRKAG